MTAYHTAVAWQGLLAAATQRVADGDGDRLVVLPLAHDTADEPWQEALHRIAQHDDGISALAAIDVLRTLVDLYEIQNGDSDRTELLGAVFGDAITYRVGDDSDEPLDHHAAREYDRLAKTLGITPSDPAPYSDELADEYDQEA